MRTGKRNWILGLLVAGFIIFFVGKFSNTTPESVQAADTRTAMERYVSAYSQYTQAELDRFQRYQSAVVQSDWDAFWAMLVRVTLAGAIVVVGMFSFRAMPMVLDGIRNRANLLNTPYGLFWIEKDSDGRKIPRPIDKTFGQSEKKSETLPVYHNGEVIEVSKDGKVISPVDDAADFLDKAIRASDPRAIELPRHESMGVSSERWSSMVHEILAGLFTVENRGRGVKTYCTAYRDLGATYYAILNKKVPLPEKKKSKK